MKRSSPLRRNAPLARTGRIVTKRPKSTVSRRAAMGQPCMVRLPGCDGGGETTVLAHYRLSGTCGMGMKPDDEQGAFCCAWCHDIADGRRSVPVGYTRNDVLLALAEGVFRTQALLRGEAP